MEALVFSSGLHCGRAEGLVVREETVELGLELGLDGLEGLAEFVEGCFLAAISAEMVG